jgi:hypothetical protein
MDNFISAIKEHHCFPHVDGPVSDKLRNMTFKEEDEYNEDEFFNEFGLTLLQEIEDSIGLLYFFDECNYGSHGRLCLFKWNKTVDKLKNNEILEIDFY